MRTDWAGALTRGRIGLLLLLGAAAADVALGGILVEQRYCTDFACQDCTSTMLQAGTCLRPKGLSTASYTVACNSSGVVFTYYPGSSVCEGTDPYIFIEPADQCRVRFSSGGALTVEGAGMHTGDVSNGGSAINVCHGTTTIGPTHPPHPTSARGKYMLSTCYDEDCYFCQSLPRNGGLVGVCQAAGASVYHDVHCNKTYLLVHEYHDRTCTKKSGFKALPLKTCFASLDTIVWVTCNTGK